VMKLHREGGNAATRTSFCRQTTSSGSRSHVKTKFRAHGICLSRTAAASCVSGAGQAPWRAVHLHPDGSFSTLLRRSAYSPPSIRPSCKSPALGSDCKSKRCWLWLCCSTRLGTAEPRIQLRGRFTHVWQSMAFSFLIFHLWPFSLGFAPFHSLNNHKLLCANVACMVPLSAKD
jgi:hypothetical protein